LWFDYGALPQVNQAMHEGKPGDMSDVHLMST
jgi:hypothetical protein